MREILFKAKRVDNGEWVEGYYFVPPRGAWIEISSGIDVTAPLVVAPPAGSVD